MVPQFAVPGGVEEDEFRIAWGNFALKVGRVAGAGGEAAGGRVRELAGVGGGEGAVGELQKSRVSRCKSRRWMSGFSQE